MFSAAPLSRLALALTVFISVCILLSLPLAAGPDAKRKKPESSTTVVISQVYGGGGNSGAPYKADFVEIFNLSNATQSLTGWSVQYAAATSSSWTVVNLSGALSPGQYYLVKMSTDGANGASLPTPDASSTVGMAATAGKVALVNNTTALTCGASAGDCFPNANIIDFVGYGTTANNYEGAGRAPAPSNTTADLRGSNGCTDTDNNNSDFSTGSPNPRNTLSATNSCGSPTSTSTSTDIPTATYTSTEIPTNTPTDIPTDTPAPTDTATPTNTLTPTETETHTPTYTPTDTPTETYTPTPSDTATLTNTPTDTPTNTPTQTPSDTTTFTPTHTATDTPTDTPTLTPTDTHTPTFTSTPTGTATDTPTTIPAGVVVINEVAWSGTSASSSDEWMELYNTTNGAINLNGWTLQASDGTPNIALSGTIPAHGYYLLERSDDNTVSDIAADKIYTGALENSNEPLTLRDGAANVIDTANGDDGAWPAGTNAPPCSMERMDALQPDTDANWKTNDNIHRNGLDANGNPICGTPKNENSASLPVTPTATFTPTMTHTPAPGGLFVNEFMPDPAQDWNGDSAADDNDEWIEIYNANAFSVDLGGWKLDDVTDGGSDAYTIPGGTNIAPNGFLIFYRADTDIALNNTNDDVRLLHSDNVVADLISYKTSQTNASWSRVPDGANYFSLYCPPTPNASNCSVAPTPTLTPTPFAKQVFINEFLPVPYQDWNHDKILDAGDEWLELYNASNHAVDLSGWKLDDAKDGSSPYKFPDGTQLDAHSFMLLFARDTSVGLNNDGDMVRLLYPDNTVADKFEYEPIETNKSYARRPDGGERWVTYCIPTPGAPNCAINTTPTPTRVFNLTSIAEARTLPLGSNVSVLGSVIAHPCEFDLYGHEAVISDGSAGLAVYMGFPARMSCLIPRSEQIVVTGVISDHYGMRTIYPESNLDLTRHYADPRAIAPRAVHTGNFGENAEAMLVTIQGKVSNGKNGDTLWVNDGTGAVEVYADEFSHTSFEGITRGSIVRITGIGYQYNGKKLPEEGYYLRVRAPDDVLVLERAEKLPEAPGKRGGVDLGAVAIDQALATKTQNYVTVGGVVTMPPGIVDDSDFWMQDASGGIHVFVSKAAGALPPMQLHDNVSVRGRIVNAFGARELRVELPAAIGVHGAGVPVAPRVLKTGQVDFSHEGALVQIVGWVARSDGREIYIDDGSGEVLVYIDADTRIRWPRLHVGDPALLTGVVSRFRGAPEILPRVQSDVQFGVTLLPIAGANAPTFLKQLRARGVVGEDLAWTQKLRAHAGANDAQIYSPRVSRVLSPNASPSRASETALHADDLITALSLLLLAASGACGIIAAHKYRAARMK